MKGKISATIICFNEERKIEDCILSLIEVVDEIIIIDSYSTDNTESICRKYPVSFIKHKFEGYVAQKNYAVQMASYDYILSLDADERLSEELKKSILEVKNNWGDVDGFAMMRYNNYCGQWINHSGWYEKKIRLWDRRKGKWGGVDPHDSVQISLNRLKSLKGDILHYAYLTIDEHIKQINHFAEVAAKAKYHRGERPIFLLNIVFSPIVRFVRCYFIQLGFLDGYYGFVFCALSACMTFLKYVRLYEYCRKGIPKENTTISSAPRKQREPVSPLH